MKLEGVNQITKLCKKKIACLRTGLRWPIVILQLYWKLSSRPYFSPMTEIQWWIYLTQGLVHLCSKSSTCKDNTPQNRMKCYSLNFVCRFMFWPYKSLVHSLYKWGLSGAKINTIAIASNFFQQTLPSVAIRRCVSSTISNQKRKHWVFLLCFFKFDHFNGYKWFSCTVFHAIMYLQINSIFISLISRVEENKQPR